MLLVVGGCGTGGTSSADKGTPTSAPAAVVETLPTQSLSLPPSTAAPSAPATVTAASLAAKLKAGLPSIRKVVQITEDNDPNNLIGRPTGYSDAAVLYDSALTCEEPGADCGATLEIWPTAEAAKDRAAYIQKNLRAYPALGSEYDFLKDAVLLRVSGTLKPSLATKYNKLFDGIPYTP